LLSFPKTGLGLFVNSNDSHKIEQLQDELQPVFDVFLPGLTFVFLDFERRENLLMRENKSLSGAGH
jgi:hypothetical protein